MSTKIKKKPNERKPTTQVHSVDDVGDQLAQMATKTKKKPKVKIPTIRVSSVDDDDDDDDVGDQLAQVSTKKKKKPKVKKPKTQTSNTVPSIVDTNVLVDDVSDQLAQMSIEKKSKRSYLKKPTSESKPISKKKTSNTEDENKRKFGLFRCTQCMKQWKSANSWVNYGQKCRTCLININPYKLKKLRRPKTLRRKEKPHPQDLCEKCKELGRNCRDSP